MYNYLYIKIFFLGKFVRIYELSFFYMIKFSCSEKENI